MAWQEVFPLNVSHIDAEEERELRLASQARAGAEWAVTALVARYQPPVTRYLTRLTGDPETSRALAERIFVHMERRLHGPHGGQHLRLWLLRSCTESGLDALRHPHRSRSALRLDGPRMAGLLPERAGEVAADRLRAGLGALANLTGSTSRQVRQLIWSNEPELPRRESKPAPARAHDTARANGKGKSFERRTPPIAVEDDPAQQNPREALRYRMVRAVLAEIPYGDAQCLALHLIAGLNQAEVAQALGITHSATRRRIVQGLQLFAQRYEAAAASLGIPLETLAPEPEAAHVTPPVRATMPPRLAQTVPPAPPDAGPPLAAPPDDQGMTAIEEHPTVVWDTPPFTVTTRTTGAPAASAPPEEHVETVESMPPPLEPVTVDAVAAPDARIHDEADTLVLEEHPVAVVDPDEDKTLVIVETTAVVDAIPVTELPVEDTAVASVAAETPEHDAVSLELAAVEVPVRPPEPAPSVEPEADATPVPAADITLAGVGHDEEESAPPVFAAAPAAARIVPVLTPAAASPRPVRIVPVLTSMAPVHAEPDTPDEPVITEMLAEKTEQAAPSVRVVPALTPVASAMPELVAAEQTGDEVTASDQAQTNPVDAPRETVALATGPSNDATLEAQS